MATKFLLTRREGWVDEMTAENIISALVKRERDYYGGELENVKSDVKALIRIVSKLFERSETLKELIKSEFDVTSVEISEEED